MSTTYKLTKDIKQPPGTAAWSSSGNKPLTGASQGVTGSTDVPATQTQRPGTANIQQTGQANTSLIGVPSSAQRPISKPTSASQGSTQLSYSPSQNVMNAQSQLSSIIANRPSEFASGYTSQLNDIYNQILGREPFQYDLANDPMYQQLRQQYTQAGRNAMEDTMGQAAAHTGGYGSSYATTAGQQAYNDYLQQLGDRVPELYQMSRDAYDAEGDALQQQYALASDAYSREYGAWQDAYDRWLSDRDFAQAVQEADRNYALQSEALALDKLSLQQQQANADREYANADRDYYFDLASYMLDMGQTPPDSILLQAGLTQAEIDAIRAANKSSSGSSRSNKSSGSSGGLKATAAQKNVLKQMLKAASGSGKKVSTYVSPSSSMGSIFK